MKEVRGRLPSAFCLLLSAFCLLIQGCSKPEDFANPYDAENLLTAGSPPNIIVRPGDRRAMLAWAALGVKGVKEYRIYRRFEKDPTPNWALVHVEPARLDQKTGRELAGFRYIVTDDDKGKGLLNDRVDFEGRPLPYVYRLTVVDVNGVETPDPNSPPAEDETPLRLWPSVRATPSEAPPPPKVDVAVADLQVGLSWESYEPPGDAVAYRVYGRLVTDEAHPQLSLLAEIPIKAPTAGQGTTSAKQYVDGDFARDLMTKEYLVTVVDKFGVESEDRPELRRRAKTPNLPPRPVTVQGISFTPDGKISLRWVKSRERDVRGYHIYGFNFVRGCWSLLKTVPQGQTSVLITPSPFLSALFVTAFDDTNRDGQFDQVDPPGDLCR